MLNITETNMRNYTYNAEFFEQWFKSSGLTITQLMKDLSVNNTSLKRWMIDKSNPLPVEKMVLLCNIYDIDLSEFFRDDGHPADVRPRYTASAMKKFTPTPPQPMTDTITKEEMLQLKLDHLQEVQRIQQEAREREETLRKDYERRIEEYKEMVRDGMQTVKMALSKIEPKPEGHVGGYGVADPKTMGGAFPDTGAFPHVNPKKR